MKRWIERLTRLEDTEGDVNELTHHGAEDDHGRFQPTHAEALPGSAGKRPITETTV